jgi:hypothetical protein
MLISKASHASQVLIIAWHRPIATLLLAPPAVVGNLHHPRTSGLQSDVNYNVFYWELILREESCGLYAPRLGQKPA